MIVPMDNKAKTTNSDFQIRTYGKSELALLYLPDVTAHAARRTLNAWINLSPGLSDRLHQTGLSPSAHYYTPAQVRMIVEALGEP
jgi:hypothetical protein